MRILGLILAGLLVLAACSPGDRGKPPDPEAKNVTSSDDEISDGEIMGMAVYDTVCAQCHEAGSGNAPQTDDPGDWSARSPMWEAVLFDHATEGYFGMPAKGGHPEYTDREIEHAAEYMLSLVYPNRPTDPH